MSVAKLNGVPLLSSGPVRWTLKSGVEPHVATFDVQTADAKALTAKAGSRSAGRAELKLNDELTIRGLYIIRTEPGPDANVTRVVVADRRHWWQYGHVLLRANQRRAIGTKRLEDPSTVREVSALVDDVRYAPYSLDLRQQSESVVWTAPSLLREVLDRVLKSEPIGSRRLYSIHNEGRPLGLLPIENLDIDDRGDAALARVLQYLPEADVTVDADGMVVVYSRADGSDVVTVESLGPESVGGGHIDFVKMDYVRPRAIDVVFTRELEVRFDATEREIGETFVRGKDDRFAENVLPVPDYSLKLASGETVPEGTWITFDEALRAWNLGTVPGVSRVTFDLIQQYTAPHVGPWSGFTLAGDRDPDAVWANRLAAIQAHFRRSYRINRRWMDRVYRLDARRVATMDSVSGHRGASQAYTDYAIIPSARTLTSQASSGHDLSYAINVLGYPADGRISADTRPAPATVRVVDHDEGIVSVDWAADRSRTYDLVLPSMIELVGASTPVGQKPSIPGPSGDLSNRQRPIAFNAIGPGFQGSKLTSAHRLSFIVTMTPAAPNSSQQFHRQVVDPSDVNVVVPKYVAKSLGRAYGRRMTVRVGPGVETARVAWLDDRASDIEQAFGVGGESPTLDLSAITLNAGEQKALGRESSLVSIARAVAAQIYAQMSDRYQGSATMRLTPTLKCRGRIAAVTHEIATSGASQTIIELPGDAPTFPMGAFLPASTRRTLFRLARSS